MPVLNSILQSGSTFGLTSVMFWLKHWGVVMLVCLIAIVAIIATAAVVHTRFVLSLSTALDERLPTEHK